MTRLQSERLLEWKLAGAITGVAHSVEDAFAVLGLVKHAAVIRWICESCREYTWEGAEAPERCPTCGHRHFDKQVEMA